MTKKAIKEKLTYFYNEAMKTDDFSEYNEIYNSIRTLAEIGLIDYSFKDFIFEYDHKLFTENM